MHEPRRRFALSGRHFSAPAERGTRTAQACSSLTGGEFFAEIQRGVALCGAREIAAPAAGTAPYPRRWAKRKGHLRFPFLFELLPFPCFLIWRRFPICDRFENRERQRIFSTVGEHVLPCETYTQCRISFSHMWVSLRRRGIQCRAIREHVIIDSTCEDKSTKRLNPQVPSVTTRKKIARHCYAALCVELTVCVAVRYL